MTAIISPEVQHRSKNPEKEAEPDAGDDPAARAHNDLAPRPAREQTECNAAQMQQPRGEHEAYRIGQRVRGMGQFRAVRVAVKNGKDAH